jgi:hypothetical protein
MSSVEEGREKEKGEGGLCGIEVMVWLIHSFIHFRYLYCPTNHNQNLIPLRSSIIPNSSFVLRTTHYPLSTTPSPRLLPSRTP